jgi:glycosyltransferase involved in cell wall biosynthesis
MKKILIFSHAMEIGGAERALLGLLEALDYSQYEVDLFLMRHAGELLKYIPDGVNLLPEIPEYTCLAVPSREVIRKGQIGVLAGRVLGKVLAKRTVKKLQLSRDNGVGLEYSHKYTDWAMPKVNDKEYDLAISFLTPHYFVANKVKAKCKIAWIHTDYSYVKLDTKSELKMWDKYDYIASISEAVTKSFLVTFPSLESKIMEIQNIMPVQSILKQVDEFSVTQEMPEDCTIKLLSIGRFCNAKNFDNVPAICKLIRKQGLNVKWYLIGFGGDEALIRSKIEEEGMQEYVIILGKKENPYPYLKSCDLYVQPSRYEGNAVTVHEAQMLGKPVVITRYATSASQLEDGVDGVIVPMDNDGCAEGIIEVLNSNSRLNQLKSGCRVRDYSNQLEAVKLYNIINKL